ncbi:MAG: threonine ammonia-lyase [Chloroflexota bacterium]
MPPVTLAEIQKARARISQVVVRTPAHQFFGGEVPGNNRLWLKAESLQKTGSFKLRGAYNTVSGLDQAERARGVITYSSGNHGQAVAFAAHLLGISAVVVMPEDAVPSKVQLTQRWGAKIEFAGRTSLDRHQRAMELVREHGYTVIPPFDDRRIIAGQGTAGLEILEQVPDVDAVLVPTGGGGLISGIATAIKAMRPDVRVIGVEPEGGADARDSLIRGKRVTWDHVDTVADGLRTSCVGQLNFETILECVDAMVTVSDAEALEAMALLATVARLVAEPSGAVAPAAALFGKAGLNDATIVAVVSGGNVEPERLADSLRAGSRAAAASRLS